MKRIIIITISIITLLLTGCLNEPTKKVELEDTVSEEVKNLDKKEPHKFVTFSFDDGTIQDAKLAALFDKYGIKCTFNVNTGSIGVKGELALDAGTVDFTKLTEAEMIDAYKNHEVAVHTVNHPNLTKCTNEEVIKEVNDDKNNIERIMKKKVVGMAWPGGPFFNDEVIDTILNNTDIKYSRETTSSYKYDMPSNFMIWKPTCHYTEADYQVNKFIKLNAEQDSLLYIWGHSWELDLHNNWDDFEKVLQKLSECDDLIFVTNSEIYYYMTN